MSKIKINPEGFITAIVQIPCVDMDKHADGKLERLAREVHHQFGSTAEVSAPGGDRIKARNT